MGQRPIPAISMRDFENRKEEIGRKLVDAAEKIGFFTLVDHVLSVEEIEKQFAVSQKYFAQPMEKKREIPYDNNTSLGYEKNYTVLARLWVSLRTTSRKPWMYQRTNCTNQLRMLYYPEVENSAGGWRHGNHTDIGCLTLVFQRDGEDGLDVMPGRKTHTSAIHGDDFFLIPAKMGPIVVNIGDMLMAWSDDRFKANWHRVRAKSVGFSPARYSLGYFNMGREDFVFQGPLKKYPAITCGEYFHNHIKKQFEFFFACLCMSIEWKN
ncbi:hypothetical protein UA08_05318 [Talaromyces atroroseus]|uniref:Fe2OG dioxygenase domain-containing protein n=1 Tax=Talaromyces atroroseus TaxID=1441469 RepID=A0A225AE15_TALAT|nr:hypothetical protein UA08_05318 [Talaromyces atroroseus]OKL59462.1 hypothetical protein UA08_05318 [Talaromyces atroroseus]